MNTTNSKTFFKKPCCLFYIVVTVLFLFAGESIFSFQVHAKQQTNMPSITGKESPEPISQKIKNKIEEINKRLKISVVAETEQTAKEMGITLAQLQERTVKLRSIKAVYERHLTALKRGDSLKKEEGSL